MKRNLFSCTTLIPLFIGVAAVSCFSQSARPAAEISFVEMKFRKPPLVDLYFDLTLRNASAESRWFILPSNLRPDQWSVAGKGGIDGVEVFAPHGKGRLIIGHFLGTGGFQALLLPVGAEVRMRLFPISFWGDLPEQLQVQVLVARRLTVGGEPAEAWFGVDPLSSEKADIDENAQSQKRFVHVRRTPDSKEVPTLIEEASRVDLTVALRGALKSDTTGFSRVVTSALTWKMPDPVVFWILPASAGWYFNLAMLRSSSLWDTTGGRILEIPPTAVGGLFQIQPTCEPAAEFLKSHQLFRGRDFRVFT